YCPWLKVRGLGLKASPPLVLKGKPLLVLKGRIRPFFAPNFTCENPVQRNFPDRKCVLPDCPGACFHRILYLSFIVFILTLIALYLL
ncbi:hypothetical protein ACIXUM_21145, partial [Bacteroides fragilis]